MTILSKLGLMRLSEHLSMLDRADRYLNDKDSEIRGLNDKYKRAVTDLAAQADEIAALKETFDLSQWEFHHGGPPDYESPLGCVYDAGIGYAYERLAEWLGVTEYEMGDGSEDYATDVGRTGANVLVAAGFVNDDGDLLTAADIKALIADAEAMRAKRKRDRDYQRAKATGQSVVQSDNGGGDRG